MHNGGIPHFSRIKLHLLNQLSTQFFHEIKGSTDSEHIFALFLTILYHNKSSSQSTSRCNSVHTDLSSYCNKDDTYTDKTSSTPTDSHVSVGSDCEFSPITINNSTNNFLPYHKIPHTEYVRKAPNDPNQDLEFTVEELAVALNMTIAAIIDICEICGVHEPCSINVCLTDGINILATRFRNGTQNPPSLYYNYGSNFVCEDGIFYSKDADDQTKKPNSIVISSAPLSRVEAYHPSISSNNLKHKATIESLAKSISELNLCPNSCSNSPMSKKHEKAHAKKNCSNDDDYGFILEQELEELDEKSIDSDDSDLNNFGCHDQDDIGSWILMPKNHMLVCRADPLNSDIVKSVTLHPIVLLKCKVDEEYFDEDEEDDEEEEIIRNNNNNSKNSSFSSNTSSLSKKTIKLASIKKEKSFDVTKLKCSSSARNDYLNVIRLCMARDKFAGSLQNTTQLNVKTKKFRSKPSTQKTHK